MGKITREQLAQTLQQGKDDLKPIQEYLDEYWEAVKKGIDEFDAMYT
ncbi:MAG TPA: hypothetical protein PLZ84_03290 [Clostridia bacterium]|nr:hypothetical protein [Clostridia bacterium]